MSPVKTVEEAMAQAAKRTRVMGAWLLCLSLISVVGVILAFTLAKDGKDAPRITEIGCSATTSDTSITIYMSDRTQYTAVCHRSNP